jgi:hypothetical protein
MSLSVVKFIGLLWYTPVYTAWYTCTIQLVYMHVPSDSHLIYSCMGDLSSVVVWMHSFPLIFFMVYIPEGKGTTI